MKIVPLEKCLDTVPNIFSLILVASRRARQLSYGKTPKVHYEKTEKPTITALQEVSEGAVSASILDEEMPIFKERNNLGFSTPGPLPPLSALSRLVQASKEDSEDSDLRNLADSELGLTPVIASDDE